VSIKIKSIESDSLTKRSLERDFLYKDVFLDLRPSVYLNRQLNKKEPLKDIDALYDIEAVKNSIMTALTTSPGDKILTPKYGIDLRRYLFEPIDDFILDIIKDDIEIKLPVMEPRVQVVNVDVQGSEDTNEIYITMQINVIYMG
jgi:phage baseplate assembly protein W